MFRRDPHTIFGLAFVLVAGILTTLVSPTQGAWTAARLTNTVDTVRAVDHFRFTHTYTGVTCAGADRAATVACPQSIAASSLGADVVDTVTTPTRAAGRMTLSADACRVVGYPNQGTENATRHDPLLVRHGVGFGVPDPWGGTQATRYSTPTGGYPAYASSTVARVLPTYDASPAQSWAYAIWFRADPGKGGTLFGTGPGPTRYDDTGEDRLLVLDVNGYLSFKWNQAAGSMQTTSGGMNDGRWHLAMVTMDRNTDTTIYVDGVPRSPVTQGLYGAETQDYWRIGWSGFAGGFAGDLSNFLAFENGRPGWNDAVLTDAGAFASWASTATIRWTLGAPATNPATDPGENLTGYAAQPCASVETGWGVAPVGQTPTLTFRLPSAYTAGIDSPVAPNSAGGVVSTLRHRWARTTSGTDVADTQAKIRMDGLHLWLPWTITHADPSSGTTQVFRWTQPATVLVLPPWEMA